jgi:hypothetical protein
MQYGLTGSASETRILGGRIKGFCVSERQCKTLGTGGLQLKKERTRFGASTDRLLGPGRRRHEEEKLKRIKSGNEREKE